MAGARFSRLERWPFAGYALAMPICGRCRVGFEPGEDCPGCGCPEGTWRCRVKRDYEVIFFLPAVVLGIIGFSLVSGVAVVFGAGILWGSPPSFVEIPVVAVVLFVWAPVALLTLLCGSVPLPTVLLCVLNGALWMLLLWVGRSLLLRFRTRMVRCRT